MKVISSVAALLASAVLLSGCTLSQHGQNAGAPQKPAPPKPPVTQVVDLDGDGVVSAGETVMSAYARTYAADPAQTVTAMQEAGGLEGFAASSSQPIAAVTGSSGAFKVASIALAPGGASLTIDIDGQSFTLPKVGTTVTGKLFAGGPDVVFHAFGVAPGLNGTQGMVVSQKYSSLTTFAKDVVAGTPVRHGGYTLVATGAETPEGALPAQIATYNGQWGLALTDVDLGEGGLFSASADFARKTLTYDVTLQDGSNGGNGAATIRGSQFAGTFSSTMTGNGKGWAANSEVVGAFYGPNGEEIAGVVAGGATTAQGDSSPVAGYFLGSKQ